MTSLTLNSALFLTIGCLPSQNNRIRRLNLLLQIRYANSQIVKAGRLRSRRQNRLTGDLVVAIGLRELVMEPIEHNIRIGGGIERGVVSGHYIFSSI
ncbi:hypothetical protein C2S51_021095 [Perilla frutescens var. frutescens]|nr:hypothetical protein C2S51_021095 [Perilla frutescens var. frutescens]